MVGGLFFSDMGGIVPKIMIEIGESVKTFILFTANAVTNDYSPGLISSFIFLLMILVAVRILFISHQRQHALQTLRKRIVALRSKEDFQQDFEAISDEMNTKKGKPNKQLAFAFSEFGETLIQPKQMGEGVVLNGIRPCPSSNDCGQNGVWISGGSCSSDMVI